MSTYASFFGTTVPQEAVLERRVSVLMLIKWAFDLAKRVKGSLK